MLRGARRKGRRLTAVLNSKKRNKEPNAKENPRPSRDFSARGAGGQRGTPGVRPSPGLFTPSRAPPGEACNSPRPAPPRPRRGRCRSPCHQPPPRGVAARAPRGPGERGHASAAVPRTGANIAPDTSSLGARLANAEPGCFSTGDTTAPAAAIPSRLSFARRQPGKGLHVFWRDAAGAPGCCEGEEVAGARSVITYARSSRRTLKGFLISSQRQSRIRQQGS